MRSPKLIVDYYLDMFFAGRCDDAFHGLIEHNADIVPHLIEACANVDDADFQLFVIDVISTFRQASSIGFLRRALIHDDPRIWKKALDGLVMSESLDAIDAMEQVLSVVNETEKKSWIEEAVSDTNMAIQEAQPSGSGRSATRPVVEPGGGEKPQSEAEGRTR